MNSSLQPRTAISRRTVLSLLIGSGLADAALGAGEDGYPERTIRLITPNSAGSASDSITRRVAEHLGKALGQTVLAENVPGAGGLVGSQAFVRAQPDGYTLGLVNSGYVVFPHLQKDLRFDPIADITPIASVAITPMVLLTRASFPASTMPELVRMAQQEPGKISFGSSGTGTATHLAGAYLQQVGNFKLLHVPYKGVSTAIPDLVSGVTDVGFFTYVSVEGLVKEGRLKVLGVLSPKRLPIYPEIPAIAETIPGASMEAWFGVLGPKGMPPKIVERLSREINAIVASNAFRQQIAPQGLIPAPMSQAAFSRFVAAEYRRTGDLVRSVGLKQD